MSMFVSLSHPLSEDDPGWPGSPGLSIENLTSIAGGYVSETNLIKIFNHFGTHMDAPGHFVGGSKWIADFSIQDLVFEKPVLLDIPKGLGEYVGAEDLKAHAERIQNADLLLIRSGMKDLRLDDPKGFSENGPALLAEGAKYLMDTFPKLRAIGSDWISIASPANMPDGIYTHHYLLGKHHDHFLFILEDVNLHDLDISRVSRMISVPLFIKGVDSTPVTLLAELE